MCEAKKKEFIRYNLVFFSSPCSFILKLIFKGIFKYFCNLFIAARCSASLSCFQVDIFTSWREGRYGVLYMGGIALDFVTVLGSTPGTASFCCCLKSLVTFSGSSPWELKESELVWFRQPPASI